MNTSRDLEVRSTSADRTTPSAASRSETPDHETPLMFCPRCGFPQADGGAEQHCTKCGHRQCPTCADP